MAVKIGTRSYGTQRYEFKLPCILRIKTSNRDQTGALIKTLDRFDAPVSSCVWAADSKSFVTGSFDKEKPICTWSVDGERLATWTKKHRTEDLAVSPDRRWLVAMDDRKSLHVYNFATRELEYEWDMKVRLTSVCISRDSRFLLVNKVDGEAQLIDIATRDVVQKYQGHTGGDCTIRSAFGGANESFVISGSEGKANHGLLSRFLSY